MRKLQTSDLFGLMRLIKKANLREELKPVLKSVSVGGMSIEDVGIEGVLSVLEIFSEAKAEQAVYEFLSGPLQLGADAISELTPNELIDILEQFAKENDLKGFFTKLAGLIISK